MLINNMHLNLNNFFRFFNYSRLINNIVILFVGFWIKVFILNANVAPIDYADISQQKAEMKARENAEKARAVRRLTMQWQRAWMR